MSHERKLLSSLILLLLLHFCTATDIITLGQSLKDGDLLVSSNETFALGFFSPGKSSNRYVGIWYKKVSEQTVVWVANRDNPISNTTGVFSVDTAGNLVIHGSDKNIPVWSTNVSSTAVAETYSAQLLDSGNLVVFHGDSKRVVVWQSFDYPTNTLLPFMKIGLNRRTGLNWFLTSWKSRDDPGTGEYSFKMDLTGYPDVFLYKGLVRLWRTGPWIGTGFSGVPQMSAKFFIFTVSYVENQDEVFAMDAVPDGSIFSRMVVNESGTLERQTWHEVDHGWVTYWSGPKELCEYYDHCGAYGYCDPYMASEFECTCLPGFEPKLARDWYLRDGTGGCVRKRGGQTCQNGEGFVKVARAKVPDTSIARVNKSMGLQACEEECLKNCSCTGYASANISQGGTGCVTWHGELNDTRVFSSGGQDLYIRVDAVELAQYLKSQQYHGKNKGTTVAVIAASSAAVLFLIICLLTWFVMRKKRGKREQHKFFLSPSSSTPLETSSMEHQFDGSETYAELPFIDLSTIVAATDNFSAANKLGQGGFGTVYKGRLHNGREIAVKRLAKNSGQGVEEFKNEVTVIAKLQHRNLVRLLGCCIQQHEKMLIYEYLPNKGLDSFIFDKTSSSILDWRKRFDIVLGIVRGMLYLHQDSRLRIIHRDLKASNVLLDSAMNPKISDFGLARMVGGDQIEANTNRVVGTYGYMSPEYALEGLFSIKSDVFSFGVLLLEIISGRKNSSYYQENSMNLIGHVWDLWSEGQALDVVDSSLGESYTAKEVLRCIHIGLLCVQEFAKDRPTMSDVAFFLSNETTLPPPKQPAFTIKKPSGPDSSSASVGPTSANDVTITMLQAR